MDWLIVLWVKRPAEIKPECPRTTIEFAASLIPQTHPGCVRHHSSDTLPGWSTYFVPWPQGKRQDPFCTSQSTSHGETGTQPNTRKLLMQWWARRDLNPQPRDYESPALTVELQARVSLILLESLRLRHLRAWFRVRSHGAPCRNRWSSPFGRCNGDCVRLFNSHAR